MAFSDDDTDRLNLLNHRLADLVAESRHLRERWTYAAEDVKTWPDMNRAIQLFVSLQHVGEHVRDDRDQ